MLTSTEPEATGTLQPTIIPAGEGTLLHAFGDTIQLKLGADQTGQPLGRAGSGGAGQRAAAAPAPERG